MTDQLLAKKAGAVGWITFNNPAKHNAMSVAMWRALPEALDAFEADPEVRVIVLKGAGEKAFISRADISEFAKERASEEAVHAYDVLVEGTTERLRTVDTPTIAMIRGYCMGGGLGLAVACDMRIASVGSLFAIPAARLGVGYRVGSLKMLTDLVGPAFAKEILITARRFNAGEAERIGLINQSVPELQLADTVEAYCTGIASNAPLSMRASKRMIHEILRASAEGIDPALCDTLVKACFTSDDYAEGRTAFMEKRTPTFKGT
jgi:enoyl-CoA hydratase/carnithine racemase